jgi:hypothetical protein
MSDTCLGTTDKRFFNSAQARSRGGSTHAKRGNERDIGAPARSYPEAPVTDYTTAGWSRLESTAMRSRTWMPPKCTSSLSEPSCSMALV